MTQCIDYIGNYFSSKYYSADEYAHCGSLQNNGQLITSTLNPYTFINANVVIDPDGIYSGFTQTNPIQYKGAFPRVFKLLANVYLRIVGVTQRIVSIRLQTSSDTVPYFAQRRRKLPVSIYHWFYFSVIHTLNPDDFINLQIATEPIIGSIQIFTYNITAYPV